jgi:hypothetical protein
LEKAGQSLEDTVLSLLGSKIACTFLYSVESGSRKKQGADV